MRIRRRYLFWGLFLISLGAIPLLVRGGYIDAAALADLWRFWPLILIAFGLALLLGRYRAGLIGVALAGIVLGTLVGGVFAAGATWIPGISDCLPSGGDRSTIEQSGTFDAPATVRLNLDCGEADLTVQPGLDWSATAEIRGEPPLVEASATELSLAGPPTGSHRQEWTIAAGSDALDEIVLTANAAASTFHLAGATMSSFEADVNAADLLVDATGAKVDTIDIGVNAGRVRITLDGPTTGSLQANAGALELCLPPDANLVFDIQEQLTFAVDVGDSGLTQGDESWTRAGSGPTIELDIEGNAASFQLDPEGGCRD